MKNSKATIIACIAILGIVVAGYYISEYNKKRAADRKEAEEQIKAIVAGLTGADSTTAVTAPYFTTPGDVTIVTDGNDFRLRLSGSGGYIGSEVFATRQEAVNYINQMHKILNPAEGKNYQPAP